MLRVGFHTSHSHHVLEKEKLLAFISLDTEWNDVGSWDSIVSILEKLNSIKDFDLNYRPSDIKPEKYYEITELFEKD